MPLFVCENCLCIENTALGHFWSRRWLKFKDSKFDGKALCSECTPTEFKDGSPSGTGKWHGKFPKTKFDKNLDIFSNYMNIDSDGNIIKF